MIPPHVRKRRNITAIDIESVAQEIATCRLQYRRRDRETVQYTRGTRIAGRIAIVQSLAVDDDTVGRRESDFVADLGENMGPTCVSSRFLPWCRL